MSSNKSEFLTVLGDRLAQERGRCGHTQKSVADQLDITARTQIKYEIGETAPDAYYLHGLGEIGIDITYVLTGVRGSTPSQQESELIACYRAVDPVLRSSLVQLLSGLSQMAKTGKKKRDLPAATEAKRIRPGRQRKGAPGSAQSGSGEESGATVSAQMRE
ncbi:helix-turn-helix domain-containing protein [Herbaspirillum huttiense]|jgi:transcriptional regulator with XRE-family HTH domain|uniref:helix-turn-helix domain-containing protein n=1 Tax=Herbaspirillum huttiense TaxID=863372 RepID=UPI00382D5781